MIDGVPCFAENAIPALSYLGDRHEVWVVDPYRDPLVEAVSSGTSPRPRLLRALRFDDLHEATVDATDFDAFYFGKIRSSSKVYALPRGRVKRVRARRGG